MMSLRCSAGINLIAGDNSLGKTFILDVAWWVLTGTWPELGGTHNAARGSRTASQRIAQPTAVQSHAARIRVFDESDVFAAVASYRDEEWGRPATWPQTRCPVIYARVDGGYSAWEHRDTAAREPVVPASSIVLLVDEPEIHLHPRWQRRLLPALLAAAKGLPGGPDVQLLVTTHSPMILTSIESSFDIKRDKIFHLRLDEDHRVAVSFRIVVAS